MVKQICFATLALFVTWFVLDFILHGLILQPIYQETANLWRPEEEMKYGWINFGVLVSAFVFVAIFAWFFAERGIKTAVTYGFLFGLGGGVSMGCGTYAVMPIPFTLAVGWFLGTVVEMTLGGLVLGVVLGERSPTTTDAGGEQ